MRYGILSYRLPRHILDAEVHRIADMGVTFEQGTLVTNVEDALEEFDAVFTAVGAPSGKTSTFLRRRRSWTPSMCFTVEEGGTADTDDNRPRPSYRCLRWRKYCRR